MADLATAYVKIVPSLQGAPKAIKDELNGIDTSGSGKKMGGKLTDGIKNGLSVGKVAIGNILANVATAAASHAATFAADTFMASFNNSMDYEQLAGGAKKIFDEIDFQRISADAQNAYKELNMSANQYLESINRVGATFSQTMGDEKGYETARKGMLAVSDYATGTGLSVDVLSEKFQMISRSTSSYQSICDQFAGILPQTNADFLAQAQAAGLLSSEYKSLTEVPVAEYQQALTAMLTQGVADLGLAQNTLNESTQTLSGSIAMTQSAWQNFLTVIGDPNGDVPAAVTALVDSASIAAGLIIPQITQIMGSIATALPQLVDELLPVLTEHSTELINALSEVIAALVPVLLEAAVLLFAAIVTALVKAIPDILANMGKMVLELIKKIVEGIAPAMNSMNDFMQGILDTIFGFFGGLWNAGVQLVQEIINGMGQTGANMASFFGGLMNAALQTVQNFFWSMYNAGANIIQGLIDGIAANIGAVLDTIMGGLQNAVDSALSFLGIHSPSKLFAGIGENTMAGFAKGIDSASVEAERSMQRAMDDVYGAADGVASVSMRAEATGSGSMAQEIASLREELRQMRLILNIDGRAFAEATVDEIDRAMGTKSRRAVAR